MASCGLAIERRTVAAGDLLRSRSQPGRPQKRPYLRRDCPITRTFCKMIAMDQAAPAGRGGLQERVSNAILQAAAQSMARHGNNLSMGDLATEAGVARATLYRYFPTRQALLDEVIRLAEIDAARRLDAARLDQVPLAEGVARAIRALVEVGDLFIVLARERPDQTADALETPLTSPLSDLIRRGQDNGSIRRTIPTAWLIELLITLVVSALTAGPRMGTDDTTSILTNLFLHGAGGIEEQAE